MPDWTQSMQRTYEYYIVDPNTWKDKQQIRTVKSCNISRDSEAETLGSNSINIAESLGECYIRVYLITVQNGIREKHALSTFLVQTPFSGFDGKSKTVSIDAYTPLLELKENPIPIGYFIPKQDRDSNTNIMDEAYKIVRERMRAPVIRAVCDTKLQFDFVANTNDTWLSFNSDLIANAKYRFDLDPMGQVLFSPIQDVASLQPVWTYTDDNSSIVLPNIDIEHDLYGVPNVVEIISSRGYFDPKTNSISYNAIYAENNDPDSPVSIQNRGRRIVHRVVDPEMSSVMTLKVEYEEYAERLLKALSSLEYTVTYTHGYCPVRLNDCVRLDWKKAGLTNIKARVIRQSIACTPDCPVTETAVFTKKLWR